ncbi:IclR family transcriptional regulator [Nesterenkonia ebinurensis]|uniref:IclR family transcriptional regulator n=1 Tax=Nesterenkonia ebinurensis TaxID=2608252 RepID=UPI00123DE72C|nr:IclR family transcriptional regulator [Nesterenkonia ebinurensis]
MAAGTDAHSVQSVDRAARILSLLREQPSLTISAIARELGVHRSTALRLLVTLESHDLVEQESARGAYRLGFGLLRMANAVTGRIDLTRDAQSCCAVAAAELNETVNVAILDQHAAVTITQTEGERMVGVARQYVGQRGPLHATSTGKILLAHADPAEQRLILNAPLEAFTSSTITDPALLADELEIVLDRGWASAVTEWEEGINALAVPVHGPEGAVVAALSTTAPAFRLPESSFAEHIQVLRQAADQLEAKLGVVSTGVAGR